MHIGIDKKAVNHELQITNYPTFQDLEKVGKDETERAQFVLSCIDFFKTSQVYKDGLDAKMYYEGENPQIKRAQKVVYDMMGNAHADLVSPNHKIYSHYVFSAITEGTQYLLGNGITFDNPGVKDQLGEDIDTMMQALADEAQIYGAAWGFWDGKHVKLFPWLQVVPLPDEYDGSIKAVIRFWQIADNKPMIAVLYEVDGQTEYIRDNGEEIKVKTEKTGYPKTVVKYSGEVQEDEVTEYYNYPILPIIPLYYINRHSILYGNTPAVDAYDLLNSRMVNNIDEGNLVYWVLRNCNGMSEVDDQNFIVNLIKSRVMHVDGDDGADATPHQIEAPVMSTETGIQRIKRLLDDNFMTCDTESIRAGNITATQIKSAYQKLDMKTSKFEYCVIEFLQRLLFLLGIENEHFTFKYDKVVNQSESITSILQAAQYLDEETVVRMLCETFGKTDIVDDVLERRSADELARFNLNTNRTGVNGNAAESAG